jgi:hypothetical protein
VRNSFLFFSLPGNYRASLGKRFVDGADGFPFHATQQARENMVEPGMLMKIKQLSEESKRRHGRFKKNQVLEIKRVINIDRRLSWHRKAIAKMKV